MDRLFFSNDSLSSLPSLHFCVAEKIETDPK